MQCGTCGLAHIQTSCLLLF